MIEKLKMRWNVASNWQLMVIFIVFTITGSAATVVRKLFFGLVGITSDTSLWLVVPLYIVTLIPAYYILLVIIGSLLGQKTFFVGFAKKSLSRFRPRS